MTTMKALVIALISASSLSPVSGLSPAHPHAYRLRHPTHRPLAALSLSATEPTLAEWLGDAPESSVVLALADGCRDVRLKLETASCDSTSCFNNFNEEEIAIDIMADMLLTDRLRSCETVSAAAVASDQVMTPLAAPSEGSYAVVIDALDGSIERNNAVSTLFGVWQSGVHCHLFCLIKRRIVFHLLRQKAAHLFHPFCRKKRRISSTVYLIKRDFFFLSLSLSLSLSQRRS